MSVKYPMNIEVKIKPKKLAKLVAKMDYRALKKFFISLSKELSRDSHEDYLRGYQTLSSSLSTTAMYLDEVVDILEDVVELAEKYND